MAREVPTLLTFIVVPLGVLGGGTVATGEAGEAEDGVLETVPEDEERIRQLEKEELSSDSEDGDKEPETAHLVLAQFDKVRARKMPTQCDRGLTRSAPRATAALTLTGVSAHRHRWRAPSRSGNAV